MSIFILTIFRLIVEIMSEIFIILINLIIISIYLWLHERDVKIIGKHINNAIRKDLNAISVVAKFATTAADGTFLNKNLLKNGIIY